MGALTIFYQQQLKQKEAEHWQLMSKINKLSSFILEECEGYPNTNMDAFETAIQIIKDQKKELETRYQCKFVK